MSTDAKARFEEECRTRRSVQGRSEGRESFATKLKEEISRFNPYCEQITYTALGCFAGTLRAVLNDGPAGIGKSRSTVGLAGLLPRIGVRVISGQVSPLALYKLLHECRSSRTVVIVDESFTLLADRVNQQMLRCALYSGTVEWRSQGDKFKSLKLPESFRFNGRIIFNTNATNETDPNHKAMLDRVYYNKLVFTGEQVATKMIRDFSMTWANTAALSAPELADDPMLGQYSKMVSNPDSQSWIALPSLGDLCGVIMVNAQEYFLGRTSAKQALDKAAEEWNAIVGSE